METATLKGTRRSKIGTKYARRLRAAGQLPAIIYGHQEDPVAIALPAHELEVELQHGARVLQVDLDESPNQYLIKSVQYDHLGTTPVHLDLMRVNLDERVTVKVGIELRGTPKGVSDGGVLEQNLNELEIECLVAQIPETLRPNVSHLEIGDALLVQNLELPEGVMPTAGPEEKVATVRVQAEELEAEPEAEGAEAAQPEVIGRAKKEDEPGGAGEK